MSETGGPEHDYEPVPGLPGRLPDGEYIVWQGAPVARTVARHVMKSRWIAGYFAVLLAWTLAAGISDGRTPGNIAFSIGVVAIMAAIVIAILEAFAWGVEKTTLYTITNRRVVMRIGVALSATFNLPYAQIVSADMRKNRNGGGDIALSVKPGQRVSWLVFWPHVRGFRVSQTEPQLIGLADPDSAAKALVDQMTSHAARMHTAGDFAPAAPEPKRRPVTDAALHAASVAAE